MMEPARISFYDQIAANKRKSYFLMFIVFLVFLLLGYVISMAYNPGSFFFIMIIAVIFSIGYILISYYNSDKIAIASVNAKPANRAQCRQYYDSVEGLTLASGLPMPKLYVMENEQINAFATGRDPQHAVVCVTTGSLQKLSKQELEGVLAHEMSHVANYDIRFMTLVAVMVGMIAIISEMFLRSLWFRSSDRESKGNAIFLIIGIVLAILAPIAVQLMQLAISRKREFTADATGVKFTRTPTGLIGALKKIKTESQPMKVNKAVSSLFMSDPARSRIQNLFSTHPDINERIRILEKM
jgi:heat shock protein HtpX